MLIATSETILLLVYDLPKIVTSAFDTKIIQNYRFAKRVYIGMDFIQLFCFLS